MDVSDVKATVAHKSTRNLQKLMADPNLSKYVAMDFIPSIFMGAEETSNIRLVFIGQDPTVKNPNSREKIKTVLNLDKQNGSLYRYISRICELVGLDAEQHVYATNFAKNFFVRPPTQIKECNLLDECSPYWLPLLREELSLFPGRPIIILGQPLLKALLIDKRKAYVRRYWAYTPDWKSKNPTSFSFSTVAPEENRLERRLFPFPHQPSLRKAFYSTRLGAYVNYLKNSML